METDLSNWGRWGKDDERGALNLITPQKTKAAAALVKEGVPVSLARFASLDKAVDDFQFGDTKHEMWNPQNQPWDPKVARAAIDTISFGTHDGTNSHLDALCHYSPCAMAGRWSSTAIPRVSTRKAASKTGSIEWAPVSQPARSWWTCRC
jgi:hypothetical protein